MLQDVAHAVDSMMRSRYIPAFIVCGHIRVDALVLSPLHLVNRMDAPTVDEQLRTSTHAAQPLAYGDNPAHLPPDAWNRINPRSLVFVNH